MGNECCGKGPSRTSLNQIEDRSYNITKQPSYVDSEGVPVPNAYKRYVKPPTTVGRQSVVVKNLNDNDDIPDWMWATQNQNILSSGTNKNHNRVQVQPQSSLSRPFANNRHTYEPMDRFKGLQTVNLSKVHHNKPMTMSEKPKPTIFSNNTSMNPQFSTYPTSNTNNYSGFKNQSPNHQGVIQSAHQANIFDSKFHPENLFQDVPVATSINLAKSESKILVKMTSSKHIPMSPFQQITKQQQKPNQTAQITSSARLPSSSTRTPGSSAITPNMIRTTQTPKSYGSHIPSVNNSIQRPLYI